MVRRFVTAALLIAGAPGVAQAQEGLLVVAHGAGAEWNARVRETVAQVKWEEGPVGIAFLMGQEKETAGWNAAVAQLVAQGARRIVVVPLMVSSYGSHYRQIRYFAGELAALPPELAKHDHGSHAPPPVPMRVTAALDDAPELAATLAARWAELGEADRRRPLLLVAHGPNDSTDAVTWIAHITAVSQGLRSRTRADLHVALLRDDAPADVRNAAVAAMRDSVLAMSRRAADSVVAMPVMISAGTITQVKIPADLDGLPIRYRAEPLAPHPELARWIERKAGEADTTRADAREHPQERIGIRDQ
jgi:sirohydrochlorin ferrochelatase